MIDLHTHLLPGLDDGANKLEEALEFLRVGYSDGVETMVATPHVRPGVFDNPREIILQRVAMVREAQRGTDVDAVTLLPGAEVYFTADVVTRAQSGELMTLGDGGDYLLLELPYHQIPLQVEDTIFQLRLHGITTVLAHPERVAYYLQDIERVVAAVRLGALTQVTGDSVVGRFGERTRQFALQMLERNLVHVIASDSHDPRHRPPKLSEAVGVAAETVGEAAALRMVEDTPRAILEGKEVEPGEPRQPPRRGPFERLRSFFRRRQSAP